MIYDPRRHHRRSIRLKDYDYSKASWYFVTICTQSQGIAPTLSLPDVVKGYKSLTTKRYIDGVNQNDLQPFNGKSWQRNYYEHIIRDESELNRIRKYIKENPVKRQDDTYYLNHHLRNDL